jgi:hypothetical protein
MVPLAGRRQRSSSKSSKRAVKTVSGLKGSAYEERLKEFGLLTFEERRHQADMVQT